jgi:hypothetical protein
MSTDTDENDTQKHRCECGRTFENDRALTSHQSQDDCETSELVGVAATSENDHGETDPDSPEAIWAEVDPVEEGTASEDFERRELSDGRPVVCKDLSRKRFQEYREQVANRQRGEVDDAEAASRAMVRALKEHFETPSFENLTYEAYEQEKLNYYDKFLRVIAPELAAEQRNS